MSNPRTRQELEKAFRLELKEFEKNYREAICYPVLDEMREMKASILALSLRKLLIDSSNMTSLVSQLGIRNDIWFSPICTFSSSDWAGNLVPVYPLIDTKIDGTKFYCRSITHKSNSNLRFGLDAWLNEIVIDPKGERKYKPTRLDVIRVIANQEGGAHYDGEHNEVYSEIINNYAFEVVRPDGSVINLCNNLYFETLLSIAFEFLESIKEYNLIKSLINKTELPSSLFLIQTAYRIDGKCAYNKYVHSQGITPKECFEHAFDTNGKARYTLIKTKGISFFSVMENKYRDYILFDFANTIELVFLADLRQPRPKSHMLVKNKKGYSFVKTNEDLTNMGKLRTYTLTQAVRLLSEGDVGMFDFSFERQYILEDKGIKI